MVPVAATEDLATSPYGMMLFYEGRDAVERDRCVDELATRALELGVTDYCFVLLDKPDNFGKAATFAIYVAIGRLMASTRFALDNLPEFSLDDYLDEPEREWLYEQACVELLTRTVNRDQFEIGFPEKLGTVINEQKWSLKSIRRGGRYGDPSIFSDSALVRQLIGLEGDSNIWYHCLASPRYAASWKYAIRSAERSLTGNESWSAAFHWFTERAQHEAPEASVSVHIFIPLNTEMILWRLPIEKNLGVLPRFELVRESAGRNPLIVLTGEIEWDGITKPKDPESILRKAFEVVFGATFTVAGFMFSIAMKDAWQLDAGLMQAHGLSYALTEHTFSPATEEPTQRRLIVSEGLVVETNAHFRPFHEFFRENRAYLNALDIMPSSVGAYLRL